MKPSYWTSTMVIARLTYAAFKLHQRGFENLSKANVHYQMGVEYAFMMGESYGILHVRTINGGITIPVVKELSYWSLLDRDDYEKIVSLYAGEPSELVSSILMTTVVKANVDEPLMSLAYAFDEDGQQVGVSVNGETYAFVNGGDARGELT